MRLRAGEGQLALADVRESLALLRRGNRLYALGWTPEVLEAVVSAAVRHGIETAYAQGLARERLRSSVLPTGELVPFLEICSLGRLDLALRGEAVLLSREGVDEKLEELEELWDRPAKG